MVETRGRGDTDSKRGPRGHAKGSRIKCSELGVDICRFTFEALRVRADHC